MAPEPRGDLAGLDSAGLGAWLDGRIGYSRRFHRALFRQLMADGRLAPELLPEWQEAEAAGPGTLARLAALVAGEQAPPVVARQTAEDPGLGTTTKVVVALADGRRVEAVHIPMAEGGHHTACVSSQVGCRMGCGFCHTASLGLVRQLAAHEIVGQVLAVQRATGKAVRNVVFMGMGEPLDNPLAVAQAVRVLVDPCGLGLALRHLTVSTIGRPEALARLGEWGLERINLAVSLFAADDDLRSAFIPANRSGGLAALRQALLALPLGRGRRVMLSVVVIPGINDGPAAVADLAAFAR
ncbi:MAG: radical SAM protein, partial [Planctomycetes bacterium]|nr:radical SAM protein [Planctomycetota bacterium]